MSNRSDIEVDFELSPRLASVATGSVEVSVQDSHDTLSGIEDSQEGHEYPKLMTTAGGENLGGGTTVGLTTTLENIQYAFEATDPRSTGAVTTPDALGITLTDSGATFVSDGVARGDWIINFDDQSVTEILIVVSETELMTRGLRNGTTNTFTITDAYKVWEVQECELSGGNFVALDDIQVDLNPLFTTFGRFATRTAASSATSQNAEAIEYASFQNGVWIDSTSSTTGTAFPAGNREFPVNNAVDALTISSNRGFDTLYIIGDYSFTTGDDIDGFTIIGQNAVKSQVTIGAGADSELLEIFEAHVLGTLDGGSTLRECLIDNMNYINGYIHQSILNPGTITLGGGSIAFIMDSFSGVPGVGTPTIDMGGSGQGLAMRAYSGGIKLKNKTGTDSVTIDLIAGQVILDNTVTNGTIVVRGNGKIVDTSGNHILTGTWNGGVTIVNETPSVLHQHTLDAITDSVTANLERAVWIDTEQIAAGDGSQALPFNTLTAAVDFAEVEGIKKLYVYADITLDRQLKNFIIEGVGTPTIDCNGQNLTKSEFYHCTMQGSYTGSIIVNDSVLLDGFSLDGFFENCGLAGDLVCIGGSDVLVTSCMSVIAGLSRPSISLNGAGTTQLSVRAYSGGLDIRDCNTVTDNCTVELLAGSVSLAASCSDGVVVVRGVGELQDNSTGTAVTDETVSTTSIWADGNATTLLADMAFVKGIEGGRWIIDESVNQMIFYKDDNTTEIARFDLKDESGVATSTQPYERVRV